MLIRHKSYNYKENFMMLFKHLLESKGLNSIITAGQSEARRAQRVKVDESVLGLLGSIYKNVSAGQQRNYDEAIEELKKEVRGCAKEFAMMQDLFIQAIRAKLNPDSAEVDTTLLQELQGRVKKEEWHIMKRELQALLEKGVAEQEVVEEEARMESEEFSFAFSAKRPPTSASEVASFGSEQCEKCSAARHAMCLLCGSVVCGQCAPKHKE